MLRVLAVLGWPCPSRIRAPGGHISPARRTRTPRSTRYRGVHSGSECGRVPTDYRWDTPTSPGAQAYVVAAEVASCSAGASAKRLGGLLGLHGRAVRDQLVQRVADRARGLPAQGLGDRGRSELLAGVVVQMVLDLPAQRAGCHPFLLTVPLTRVVPAAAFRCRGTVGSGVDGGGRARCDTRFGVGRVDRLGVGRHGVGRSGGQEQQPSGRPCHAYGRHVLDGPPQRTTSALRADCGQSRVRSADTVQRRSAVAGSRAHAFTPWGWSASSASSGTVCASCASSR